MNIRILYLKDINALRSQAIYHGLAQQITENDDPILAFVRPSSPYICIGMHQNIDQEINREWCTNNNLPIIRRSVGGGTVFLDQRQLFFQYIFPKNKAPKRPDELYRQLLRPIVNCYQKLGCPSAKRVDNDIHINEKKICGTGAASIENATVFVGSFLFDFNFTTMANCILSPSPQFSETFASLMQERMTTIANELNTTPDDTVIIDSVRRQLQTCLGLSPVDSKLSKQELESIQEAERELTDEEWINQDGNRLIKNGIKIAANTYLLEHSFIEEQLEISIRLIYCNERIDKIWITTSKADDYYEELEHRINIENPDKNHILALTSNRPALSAAIDELLSFSPY